jgi:hypothetical protein
VSHLWNPDGCNNILTTISPDPFYTSGWIDGNNAGIHDFMTNSSVTTRPKQTMHNCPRTYCQGYWSGYRSGWITQIDVAGNGPCFPAMQKLPSAFLDQVWIQMTTSMAGTRP